MEAVGVLDTILFAYNKENAIARWIYPSRPGLKESGIISCRSRLRSIEFADRASNDGQLTRS